MLVVLRLAGTRRTTYCMDHGGTSVLVAVKLKKTSSEELVQHLDELSLLAKTMGLHTIERFVQSLPYPDVRTFIRKGKLEEIKAFVRRRHVDCILFDDDLSPSQLRNLEKALKPADGEPEVRLYDRSLLILNIFLRHAQTAQARAQVELAMNQYLLPRLKGMWTHLERQRGGTGTRGGAGEKELETDRRNIGVKIATLKKKLAKIDRQSEVRRKARSGVVRVALVGYTNTGKSTLMNRLAGAHVKAENKLFATLDTVVRKVVIGNIPFLLSDTVGFIRKLPTHLIESFKSTLDEVREADLLLHVVDVGNPSHRQQIETVNQTLVDIGVADTPTLLILNKVDRLKKNHPYADPEEMLHHYRRYGAADVALTSALAPADLTPLKEKIFALVKKKYITLYPHNKDTPPPALGH